MTARRANGFTLIELLVALTLFGLISVVVMGGTELDTEYLRMRGWRINVSGYFTCTLMQ